MEKPRPLYFIYLLFFSLVATASGVVFFLRSGSADLFELDVFLILLSVSFVARFFSIPLGERIVVSLDTVLFVSSLFVLGTTGAALIVLVNFLSYQLWRFVIQRSELPRAEALLVVWFGTSTGTALLILAAGLFDVDALLASIQATASLSAATPLDPPLVPDVSGLPVKMAGVTLLFIVLQYTVVVGRYFLRGMAPKPLFREVMLPGIGTEAALIPLTVLLVFSYHKALLPGLSGPNATFLLVLLTYAAIVIGIHYLTRYGALLKRRLGEMEKVNHFHGAISGSLQLDLVADLIVEDLLDNFPDLSGAAVVLQRENLIRIRGRTDDELHRFETYVRRQLSGMVNEDAAPHVVFLPIGKDGSVSGHLGLYRDKQAPFSADDRRLYQLLLGIIEVALENARLYELATVDGLTGLHVRRYFEQRLMEEFIRARRYQEDFSLVVIDMNRFKWVNDQFGHLVGDRILKDVGNVLLGCVRSMDVAARYGGDEFALLLPRADHEAAEEIAGRVQSGIKDCSFEYAGTFIDVSASIGISSYLTDQIGAPTEMILKADSRMYEAKTASRDDPT